MQQRNGTQPLLVRAFRVDELVTVAVPMPGLSPEDITIEVTGRGHLILAGKARAEGDEAFGQLKADNKHVLLDEWAAGPYHRDIPLNTGVDGEAATVTYGNGVLVVALPVADHSRPAHLTLESTGPGRGERLPR